MNPNINQHGDDDLPGDVVSAAERQNNDGDLAAEILDVAHRIAEAEAGMLDVASAKVRRSRLEQEVEGRDEQDQALLDFFADQYR